MKQDLMCIPTFPFSLTEKYSTVVFNMINFFQRTVLSAAHEAEKGKTAAESKYRCCRKKINVCTVRINICTVIFYTLGIKIFLSCRHLCNSIDENFKCGICLEIPVKACATAGCNHLFCLMCLKTYFQ
jgi:hypothetical protein